MIPLRGIFDPYARWVVLGIEFLVVDPVLRHTVTIRITR